MKRLEKALKNLTQVKLKAEIVNNVLYIIVDDYYLELADTEINYWAFK